jgi:hypothetical protein
MVLKGIEEKLMPGNTIFFPNQCLRPHELVVDIIHDGSNLKDPSLRIEKSEMK